MSKPLMIVKPGSVSPKDKEKLSKNGYLVIEHPFPGDVKFMDDFSSGLSGDDILRTALESLGYGNDPTCRHAFADLFRKRLIERIKPTTIK